MAEEKMVAVMPIVKPMPWSKDIVKVRITPARHAQSAVYNGKTYTKDSEPVAVAAAGGLESLQEANATGDFCIEKFNKDEEEVDSLGLPLKKIVAAKKRPMPKQLPAEEEENPRPKGR